MDKNLKKKIAKEGLIFLPVLLLASFCLVMGAEGIGIGLFLIILYAIIRFLIWAVVALEGKDRLKETKTFKTIKDIGGIIVFIVIAVLIRQPIMKFFHNFNKGANSNLTYMQQTTGQNNQQGGNIYYYSQEIAPQKAGISAGIYVKSLTQRPNGSYVAEYSDGSKKEYSSDEAPQWIKDEMSRDLNRLPSCAKRMDCTPYGSYIVEYNNGKKIEFKSMPTPQDIEEAYNQAKGINQQQPSEIQESVEELTKKVASYYQNGDNDLTITYATKLIKLKPNSDWAYSMRAFAYNAKGNNEQAILDFSKAIEINPKAEYYDDRGLVYAAKGNNDQAILDCNKSIELKPNYADAYYARGCAYGNKNNSDQAISDFSRAIELNPKYALAYEYRGLAYARKKEYDKAWADVHKAESLGEIPSYIEQLKKSSGRDK